MLQEIFLNYTFNQECIEHSRVYWITKRTNKFGRTVNGFHFRELSN